MNDQETWKNITPGTVVLKRLDHRGELTKDEIVSGQRTFHISSAERKLNQERAAGADLDVFLNGTLHPLRLIEGTEDAKEMAANPNLMSETDMRSLVKVHFKTFEKRLPEIGNASTLQRLLAVAHEEDASVSRVEAIQARIDELSPGTTAGSGASMSSGGSAPGMRPVTPR